MKRRVVWLGSGATLALATMAMLQLNWSLDYTLLNSFSSPDGRHTAWEYGFEKMETPPYGIGVALSRGDAKPHYFAKPEFVFKGMCRFSQIRWKDKATLVIRCDKQESNVVFHRRVLDQVAIEVEISSVAQ
jgi:hypothetical protein